MQSQIFAAVVVLCAWPDGAWGQDGPEPAPIELPSYETVVTASRTPQLASDAPVTTFVIPRSEIERSGARNVAELLATQGGVQLSQSVTGGTSVAIQGLTSEYVLILIDGDRAIGRTDGVLDLSRLFVEDIERIEIVPGASSALYGADALGGVVNIVTRRSAQPLEAEASARYGSRNSVDLTGNAGQRFDLGGYHLSAALHRADGYDLDKSDATTSGSKLLNYELAARGDIDPTSRTHIKLRAEYDRRDLKGVDASATGAILDRRNLIESLTTNARLEQKLATADLLTVSLTYSNYRDQFAYDQRLANDLDQYQDSREQQGQLYAQYNHTWSASHVTIIGVEGIVQALKTTRLASGKADRQRGAVYLQHTWSLGDFDIVPGARFDHDSQFGSVFTPKLSLKYAVTEDLTLRASYGEGFRAPDFKELYLLFDNPSVGYRVTGNADLEPERSRSLNVSGTWKALERLEITASGYVSYVRNMIVDTTLDGAGLTGDITTLYTYGNIAKARTLGFDLQARFLVVRDLWLDLGYGFLDGEDRNSGDPLPQLARHRASAQARYRYRPWGITATVRAAWTGERPFYRDSDGDGVNTIEWARPYTLVDARVAKKLGDAFEVFVGAQNLAGVGDALNLPIAPRFFYGGVTARY